MRGCYLFAEVMNVKSIYTTQQVLLPEQTKHKRGCKMKNEDTCVNKSLIVHMCENFWDEFSLVWNSW